MNEHVLDAMIYAWRVMKEKEENKMEGIFMGQITGSCSRISEEDGKRCVQVCFHDTESNACGKLSHYNKTYSLVLSDDVIKTNDELLKLRDEVKEMREERDYWKNRWNSVVTDVSKTLAANGVELTVKEIDDDEWKVVIDIPELNEAKAKVADLEKKLADSKSKETFWRDRKEEEEDYHHYWLHTFDRAVKQAADKGIHIDVRGTDEDCNAGVVVVDNVKANELESQVVQMEDANQKLRQRISAADEEIEKLVAHLKVVNHRAVNLEKLAEYWNNTRKDLVARGKTVGVKIESKGNRLDSNAGDFDIPNEKAIELMVKVGDTKHEYNKKWQAMLDALKAKGVEVIYMGEEGGKPIIDIKIPGWDKDKEWVTTFSKQCADIRADKFRLERERDELKEKCDILRKDGALKGQQCLKLKADLDDLKKELEALKSRTLDNVEIRLSCGDIVWTYCDGFVHVSSGISGIISADQITTGHINCLCKNYVPVNEEEPECKDCKYYRSGSWRSRKDGEALAECRSPLTDYDFCQLNCNGKKACPHFERKG